MSEWEVGRFLGEIWQNLLTCLHSHFIIQRDVWRGMSRLVLQYNLIADQRLDLILHPDDVTRPIQAHCQLQVCIRLRVKGQFTNFTHETQVTCRGEALLGSGGSCPMSENMSLKMSLVRISKRYVTLPSNLKYRKKSYLLSNWTSSSSSLAKLSKLTLLSASCLRMGLMLRWTKRLLRLPEHSSECRGPMLDAERCIFLCEKWWLLIRKYLFSKKTNKQTNKKALPNSQQRPHISIRMRPTTLWVLASQMLSYSALKYRQRQRNLSFRSPIWSVMSLQDGHDSTATVAGKGPSMSELDSQQH